MKMYYKLVVTAEMPHNVKMAFVHAFNLMEVCDGRKWVTFYGMTSDIETACDLIMAEGYTARKVFYRGGKL